MLRLMLTLLDVVVLESTAILELLTREDKTLLVWRDALLVLDLGLDGLDGVGALNLKGDGLSRKGLDENLHSVGEKRVREVDGIHNRTRESNG